MPPSRSAPVKVVVFQWPWGIGALWLLKTWSTQKGRILIRALIAVLMRPELQTVGFAPQRRSTDDCYTLDGDYQILDESRQSVHRGSLALGGPQTDSSSVPGRLLVAKAAPEPDTDRRNPRSRKSHELGPTGPNMLCLVKT